MTQAQLAEITGISQPNLSAYENDRRSPSLDVANRIFVACGYQLIADAGARQVPLPLPGREPVDMIDGDPPPISEHRRSPPTLQERGDAAWEVLELAEAFR